ncbi:Ubiquitin-like domain-containing protein [Aphelenchoides besseyi]|nr:Ubiquitin-like domain-containing protein [Aphelenchoides besseyi]
MRKLGEKTKSPTFWHLGCWESTHNAITVPPELQQLYDDLKASEKPTITKSGQNSEALTNTMELIIDLQDHTGKSHRKVLSKFGDEATVEQLKNQIQSTFQVPVDYQEIFCGEERIDLLDSNSLLSQLNLKRVKELILKHSDIDLWKSYCECAKEFRRAYGENKKTFANDALVYSTQLRKTSFFIVYPKFGIEVLGHHRPIGNFLDKSIDSIKDAATNLFNWVTFKGQSPNIAFEPVDDNGTRPAVRFIDWIKKRRGARVTMPIEFNTETEYSTTRIELATEQNLSANQQARGSDGEQSTSFTSHGDSNVGQTSESPQMILFAYLRDHEDKEHKEVFIEFANDQATLRELRLQISKKFNIDQEDQMLFLENGTEIAEFTPDDMLHAIGLQHKSKLIVKHSDIDLWKSYCECAKEFRRAYGENKKTFANDALVYSTQLRKTSFFIVYPKFGIEVLGHHRPIGNFLDKSIDSIKDAATNLFNWVTFKGQSPNIAFEPVDDNGTRPAVRCTVTVNAIIHEYRIKCNHDAGGTNSAMRFKPNMIELYCYKVLEAIGVGAKVTFFRNLVESRLIIYIASRLLPNFTEMGKILHSDFDPEQVRRSLVQIHFLSSFLSLGDMSNANIGLNTDGSPVIVDFMMSNYDPIEKFLNNTDTLQGEECKKILEDCNVSKRLEIAKESIVKWSFVQKLDEAEKKLDEEKEIFGRAESDFEKKTEDVKIFIDRVKSNVKDLLNRDTDTSFSLLNLHADLDPNHKWFYI